MQIFTGILQARPGKEYEAAALMPQIRDVAQAAHGVETSAWAVIAGSTWGSFALSTRVDGLAQLLEVTAAVGESDDFRALAAQTGEVYAGPAQTSVATVVAATADDVGRPADSVGHADRRRTRPHQGSSCRRGGHLGDRGQRNWSQRHAADERCRQGQRVVLGLRHRVRR